MTLKKRLILLLFGALIIFGLLLYTLQYLVIVPGYGALEKDAARAANTVILAAIGIVIIIFLLVYLHRFILKPISNLSRHAVSIRETDDLSLRCSTPRNDEIGVLSREIDHLVERLLEDRSDTHRKLKAEIDGHRKAEETLKEQQAFLRQLFENSPFGIVVMDAHNNILDINREFESIFQYSLKEIKGKSIDDVVVPGNKTDEAADVTARTFQGETVQIETVRERKDGRPVEVIAYGVPIYLDGTRIGVYAIYMDITELRENQREKNRLKDRLVEAKKWKPWAPWPGGWHTSSTTLWPLSWEISKWCWAAVLKIECCKNGWKPLRHPPNVPPH
ncbi:MAG: PAS domain S-box protein [bacterium]|nr:PAS domain S-box protein [bacterium]